MYFDISYPRTIPARRPPGFKPPVQRYNLRWRQPVHAVVSDYFAIQGKELPWERQRAFFDRLRASFAESDGPGAFELMRFVDAQGFVNAVAVAYWLDPVQHARWSRTTSLAGWWSSPEREREDVGYWHEAMVIPYDRHETNYSYTDYRIGLARCEPGELAAHDTNAYFGAMRDRIPLSAVDPLDSPLGQDLPRADGLQSHGRRVCVGVPLNVAAIRSGQYWAKAGEEQYTDYVENLQQKLLRGMDYLDNNKLASGCAVMRMMYNVDDSGNAKDESSVLAYFLSLGHLEAWSHSHKTHLDIYQHAIAMMRKYKEKREVRTWHEVFVLPTGMRFEYVNCHPETGLLPFFG